MLITISLVCSQILIILGVYGIFIRRDNLIISLIFLELILLGIALNFSLISLILDDFTGLMIFFILLVLAGVESALGLALVIVHYRIRVSVSWTNIYSLKG